MKSCHVLQVGDLIDLLDENDVYCPAMVLELNPVKVSYIGWGSTWDEIVDDESRIEPPGKHVRVCKAWVKFSKLIHWPCTLYLRRYREGSDVAIPYLEEETNVLVKLFGPTNAKSTKYYAGDTWVKASNVWPFHTRYEMKWTAAGLSHPKYGDDFRAALKCMDLSNCEELQFKFVGTHDVLFTNRKAAAGGSSDTGTKEITDEERKQRRIAFALSDNSMGLLPLVDGSLSSLLFHAPVRPSGATTTISGVPNVVQSGFSSSDVLNAVNESLRNYFCSFSSDELVDVSGVELSSGSTGAETAVTSNDCVSPNPESFILTTLQQKMDPILQDFYVSCVDLKQASGSVTGKQSGVKRNSRKQQCPRKIELRRKKKKV